MAAGPKSAHPSGDDDGAAPRRIGGETKIFLVLVSVFALLGVLLAGVGVYGTTAYWVAQRMRELGLRMALGATRGRIVGLVLGRGLRLAELGAGIGLAGAMATLPRSGVFPVRHRPERCGDADRRFGTACFSGAHRLLLAGSVRASRLDPADVLRSE